MQSWDTMIGMLFIALKIVYFVKKKLRSFSNNYEFDITF